MSVRPQGRRHLGLLGAGAALLTLAMSPLLTGTAIAAGGTGPTPPVASVVIDQVVGESAPAGTSASAPSVLTAVGRTITVAVRFYDAAGLPASFGKATDVALVTSQGGGGSVSTVAATDTGTTLTSAPFSAAANRVTLTVTVPGLKGSKAIPPAAWTAPDGTVRTLDVLSTLASLSTSPTGLVQQVSKNGTSACGDVTAENPFCATVILPRGAGPDGSSPVVIGTGACDSTYALCPSQSYVVELLADLSTYTSTSPATVILDCDKKFCGRGSIKDNVPSFALGGNDTLTPLPACAAKGVAPDPNGSGPYACVDYVQSTRDNAGDTHLWVLFARDARMSCC
jgi:hypothetical protein